MTHPCNGKPISKLAAHNTSGVNGMRLRRRGGRLIVCAYWRHPQTRRLVEREVMVDLARPTTSIRSAMAFREEALSFRYPFTALFAWRQLSRRIPD